MQANYGVENLYRLQFLSHIKFLVLISFVINGSASAILDSDCLSGLAKASGYGNGWVKKNLVHAKVLASGKEAVFYHTYQCANCSRENSMKPNTHEGHTVCAGCGKPHSNEPTYQKKIRGVAVVHMDDFVTRTEELPSAKGKRWKCSSCGNTVPSETHSCPGCGDKKTAGTKVRVRQGAPTEIRQEDGKSELPEVPFITQQRLAEFFNPPPKPSRPKFETAEPPREQKWYESPKNLLGMALAGIGGSAVTAWLLSTKDYVGTVTSTHWHHEVPVEEFTPVRKEDWCDELSIVKHIMPLAGAGERAGVTDITKQGEREHHTVKEYAGTRKYQVDVPYTEEEEYEDTEEVDLGNGASKIIKVTRTRNVTKYRKENRVEDVYVDKPVYKDWCSYLTYEWKKVTPREIGGTNPKSSEELVAPNLNLSDLQRGLPMQRTYTVDFNYQNKGKPKEYTLNLSDPRDYMNWRQGDKATLVKRNLGTIKEVKKLSAEQE